ncbi:MAG: amidohydrolase family protein [Ignavibacteriae bacterium]|nr:amidohydrolase family protein [Ignavibacteriota bacterium]
MRTNSFRPNAKASGRAFLFLGEDAFELVVKVILSIVFLSQFSLASDPVPAAKQKKPVALVGGTIHTVSGETISNGTILFDKGKIVTFGQTVNIPADAERVDITGKHVYPGLIDSYSNMGLTEIGSVRGTIDGQERGTINPNTRAEVAVDAESEMYPVARSSGILIAGSTPSGGLISGTSAALMMDGWTWEDMTLKAPLGLFINWPGMVYVQGGFGGFGGGGQMTKENWLKRRDEQLKSLRDAFAEARAYATAKKVESQRGVPYHQTDSRWEAMIPVIEGKVPVFVNANEVAQIQAAVTWAEQEAVKLVIVGGRDAWQVSNQLKAKDIPVIVQPILFVGPPRRYDGYDAIYSLPNKLREAGVRFCISGDGDASNSRNVPHHAATAAAFGLPKDDALKAVTLYAAQILGIADRVGSLETGKDATLIITNGDPLELSTTVEQAYIQGKKIDMRDKHKRLYQKYQEKYKQLSEK